jgi:hypothetical protein
MANANTVADTVKSVLAPSITEGFKGLADKVGGYTRTDRKVWAGFKADFKKLAADFPRLADGSIDRKSDACEEARDVFVAAMMLSLTGGSEYDRELHQAGGDEFHVPSDTRPANFTLTGRNAVSMDKASLAKLPSLVDNPMGLRRFVESIKKTVDNTATKRWSRFFEADFIEQGGSKRGANTTTDEWLNGLAKPMVAKLGADRKAGRKVATNDAAKKALAEFRKKLLG